MIQDIAPHTLDNQFKHGMVPDADSPVFLFPDGGSRDFMAHVSEGRMRYPVYKELPEGILYTYLFSIDGEKYFMGIPEDKDRDPADEGGVLLRRGEPAPGLCGVYGSTAGGMV